MVLFSWSTAKLFPPNFMWCSCSVCDQWRKLNTVAFKFILPRHKDPCNCTCVFCDGDCQSLERLSPRYLMQHLFCPPSCQFHVSNVSLYDWDCIFNRCTVLFGLPVASCLTSAFFFMTSLGVVLGIVFETGAAPYSAAH